MTKLYSFSNFNLKLKNQVILKNISFEIFLNDRIGIVGPNGSGKSTLLRVLAGIYPSNSLKLKNLNISYISSLSSGTDNTLSVYNNILRLNYFNYQTHFENQKFKKYLSILGLEKYLNENFGSLSKGYKMRVLILSFLLRDASILILDELFGVLDKSIIEEINNLINDKITNINTLILSSHNSNLISKFCNRVIELNEGSIVNKYYL